MAAELGWTKVPVTRTEYCTVGHHFIEDGMCWKYWLGPILYTSLCCDDCAKKVAQ